LPYAAREVETIADIFATTPHLGRQARESLLHREAAAADVLHLAAHGIYLPHAPFASRIELAGDEAPGNADLHSDGDLEVREVYGLDLREVDLVVLSACNTGLGPRSEGDEIIGMTRAFLYAGAPLVVTTLWPIDDAASAALMASFYRHLLTAEHTPVDALRQAQLDTLTHEEWSSPYFWAAFVPTGAPW